MLQKRFLKFAIASSIVSFFVCSCSNKSWNEGTFQLLESDATCPRDMVHVSGDFCTSVEFSCVEELPNIASAVRCNEFAKSFKGCDKKLHLSFCIDKTEWSDSSNIPRNYVSYVEAEKLCVGSGKRICEEREWTAACEGVDPTPYPTGYSRPVFTCNIDHDGRCGEELCDRREKFHTQCVSSFGVYDMVGNVDEWVHITPRSVSIGEKTYRIFSGLKGGHWGPVRNRCRPVTDHHYEWYVGVQTGFRCCKDAK